jgi:hypothetical protein
MLEHCQRVVQTGQCEITARADQVNEHLHLHPVTLGVATIAIDPVGRSGINGGFT